MQNRRLEAAAGGRGLRFKRCLLLPAPCLLPVVPYRLLNTLFFLLFVCHSSFAQEKPKPITEVSVIKFDNYDKVDGEEKIFFQRYLQDSLRRDVAPVFDALYAIEHFKFPPPSDTLTRLLSHKPATPFKPAEYDTHKRLLQYYRSPVEHYIFEYNTFGNLANIQRW
ncbi:MAG TPA: hypothetical protein VNZ86_17955, partial [Bacteroidia bacterium]|nr:hypothetical protein [Bacteroidia bacterium]